MKTSYLVSFGNSTKYKVTLDHQCNCLDKLKDEVREYIGKHFPQLAAPSFYEKMTIEPIPADKAAAYAGYEELSPASVPQILKVLTTEIEDANSLDILNRNAPFADL